MQLHVNQKLPGCADGMYTVTSKTALAAALYWATEAGPLEGWSSFAVIPIAEGKGSFRFTGFRAVPAQATHVYARGISGDLLSSEECLEALPTAPDPMVIRNPLRLTVMSDIHLSAKPWVFRRALLAAEGDAILLAGDLTNDAKPEQFRQLRKAVAELCEGKPVFSVTGNHDQLRFPLPSLGEDCGCYNALEDWLWERAENMGIRWDRQDHGAWSVRLGDGELIGLQCVSHWRRFVFPRGEQLAWLEAHLAQTEGLPWRILLCHAPLLAHNPQRNQGDPYLSRDKDLQRILDQHRNLILISGHTHYSPNNPRGNVEMVSDKNHIYLDDGSVTPTQLNKEEPLIPPEWKQSTLWEFAIGQDQLEIKAKSAATGTIYPRGYYCLTR